MAAIREQSRARRLVAVADAANRPDGAVVEGRPDRCAQAWENGIATWRWVGVAAAPSQRTSSSTPTKTGATLLEWT